MEGEMEKKIEETVTEILKNSDMEEMTEYKVRKAASQELGFDLSSPHYKKFVRKIVESFLVSAQTQAQAQAQPQSEAHDDDASNKTGDGEFDDDGDLIICRLSNKRRVTIQDFRGKTLVSIREYYERDGKQLPTSKGISLTIDQWAAFKKSVPDIEAAIKKMESRLN